MSTLRSHERPLVDVAIIGGGPAGLAAALTLGRARRSVALFDAGPRRNAAATHIHNFVTRDGTPPDDFRAAGRADLTAYPSVAVRDLGVNAISGERDDFTLSTVEGPFRARRIILTTGMVDERLPIAGFDAAWGHSIFQCPFCHGWEAGQGHWGYLALTPEPLHHFPIILRSWTDSVTVFTNGAFDIAPDMAEKLTSLGIRLESRPIAALEVDGQTLKGVTFGDGEVRPCDALFAHPPQHQVPLVASLGLDYDADGFVKTDPMMRETSRPGIFAAGDLTTRGQGAVLAASAGAMAGSVVVFDLMKELADGSNARS